jgi:signal transduction histidine kinase
MSTEQRGQVGADSEKSFFDNAFADFKVASVSLEDRYKSLEDQVETLNLEITEKSKTVERSRRLAALGEMGAKIAHEIRNPLASIGIFSSLLERELEGDAKQKELAGHISKGVKTLDTLLTNMLLFARSPEPRQTRMDVKSVLDTTLHLISAQKGKNVKIETQFIGQTTIKGDESLLGQAFFNLLINAVDAVGEQGCIKVTTCLHKNGSTNMKVTIEDTGSGITSELVDRVFDPFFTTKDHGTGLGLAIVESIVKSHGGHIEVESYPSDTDRGTTFTVVLPVDETEAFNE